MVSLKPVEEGENIGLCNVFADKILLKRKGIDACFPYHLAELKLNRIFRCTYNITKFYEVILKSTNQSNFHIYSKINSNSTSCFPGHEVYGERLEILLLPQCLCFDKCYTPMKHLFLQHKSKIIAFMKRALVKNLKTELTIIIDTFPSSEECIIFLREEVVKNNLSRHVIVKDIAACRGLEYPSLMTITNDANRGGRTYGDSSTIEAWTRVTSSLFIIHMEGKYSKLSNGLKDSIKRQLAKKAEEHENFTYSIFKEMYLFLKHPFFIPFLLPLHLSMFLLVILSYG